MIGMSGLSLIWPSCVPSLPPKSLIFSFLEFVESSIRNVISFIALNVPTDFQREKMTKGGQWRLVKELKNVKWREKGTNCEDNEQK